MKKLYAWWRKLRRRFETRSQRRLQRTWRPEVDLLERRDLPSSSQVVLISLDGTTPALIDQYIASGVLDPNSGLGSLRTHGLEAQRNETITPSLTAPGHIAIATGSSAANNDVVGNSFRLLASPFTSTVSGFAAPIGGYDIHGPAEDASPTANPVWQ